MTTITESVICSRCHIEFKNKRGLSLHMGKKILCKVKEGIDVVVQKKEKKTAAVEIPITTDNESANLVFDLINQAEKFGNNNIDIIICNNESWFCGNDIATILNYRDKDDAIRKHIDYLYKMKLVDLYSSMDRKPLGLKKNEKNKIYINRNGLIQLLTCSKMPNKSDFIRWCKDKFDINYDIITRLYKEQETIGQIIKLFDYKNPKTQYQIDGYRIDLYFPNDKLAIECDEFGHKYRNLEYERRRETYIKNKLDCKFSKAKTLMSSPGTFYSIKPHRIYTNTLNNSFLLTHHTLNFYF